MNTKDSSSNLEKHLQIIGKNIRLRILKILYEINSPIPFMALKRRILEEKGDSSKISYHLNILKENNFILSGDEGYFLTKLGGRILEKLLDIGDIINEEKRNLQIRTSNYTFELFDLKKIVEYLIRESEMPEKLARKIANEVKLKLSNSKVNYLTTPLIREYLNGILIEKGFEEYRHKLTRLGLPPFEVESLIRSQQFSDPKEFLKKLGSEVSEQYLLLNLLPREFADLYLSGQISLLHLDSWALRPLSISISNLENTNNLDKSFLKIDETLEKTQIKSYFSNFISILTDIKKFFNEDILLNRFNEILLSILSRFNQKDTKGLLLFLLEQFFKLNLNLNLGKSQISLDFSHGFLRKREFDPSLITELEIDLIESIKIDPFRNFVHLNPLMLYDCSDINSQNFKESVLTRFFDIIDKSNLLFYRNRGSNPINNILTSITQDFDSIHNSFNKILLDKIFINLPKIALESKQNDQHFLELLDLNITAVFEIFKIKQDLIKKYLNSFHHWKSLSRILFNNENCILPDHVFKAISFFGLNESILYHCNIELDRIDQSQEFAKQILTTIKNRINEINNEQNEYFIFSQPHIGNYLMNRWNFEFDNISHKYDSFSTEFIRFESKLNFEKKVSLFKTFQKIVNGGTLFNILLPDSKNIEDFHEKVKYLITYGIHYFCFSSKQLNYYNESIDRKGILIRPDTQYIDSDFLNKEIVKRYL